tara:strand:+ start:332 stop:898 length:567 start_codon:yes stop_codon:yes gene_type:complete
MKLKYLIAVFCTFFILTNFSAQKNIEGVDFPETMTVNNTSLVLNGGGLREKYFTLDLYVGALYLKATSKNADKIIMADENMSIRIVIVSSMVTRERFIEALEDGFKNTTAGKSTPEQIAMFKKYFKDPFVEGDEIILNYHQSDAVYLYKNGKERGSFKGLDFKQALFGIWLGGKPADTSLKEDMLGND